MSAATGLAKQEDGLEKLLALANLKASDIAAAGDETRRQMQLTQAEEAKLTEARTYIAKHSALATDLQSRESALIANQVAHEDAVKKHTAFVASENKRLEDFSAKLDAREKATNEMSGLAEQTKKNAENLKAEYERQHQVATQDIGAAQAANTTLAGKLATESQRLTDWEATLKRKAELLRQQVANF